MSVSPTRADRYVLVAKYHNHAFHKDFAREDGVGEGVLLLTSIGSEDTGAFEAKLQIWLSTQYT